MMKDIWIMCARYYKNALKLDSDINEPNQPITVALAGDVMNFISAITREGMKSKCSFWQCKLHCFPA